jgi:hypothetical protein
MEFVDIIHKDEKVIKYVNTLEEADIWKEAYESWGYRLQSPFPQTA